MSLLFRPFQLARSSGVSAAPGSAQQGGGNLSTTLGSPLMIALTDLALGRAPLASEEIRWVAAEHTSHDPLHPMLAIEPLKLALELLLATLLDRQSSGGALP